MSAQPTRRAVIAGAGAASALTALPATTAHANPAPPGSETTQVADRLAHAKHRLAVPEIFRTPKRIASHTDVIVIGTGFGGSVAALRLGRSGAKVAMLERGSRWPYDPWRRIHAGDMRGSSPTGGDASRR